LFKLHHTLGGSFVVFSGVERDLSVALRKLLFLTPPRDRLGDSCALPGMAFVKVAFELLLPLSCRFSGVCCGALVLVAVLFIGTTCGGESSDNKHIFINHI